ncbi:hypothetical protein BCR44DRAFT_1103359 [Catenaria anguillulae PL171]|uniref:Uncharacterized protein n=1 Tax=Catenaria anguillulae PL171 TaxID=765915 RepID=A0A1Y2I269_9FUNG|nr:hypothetical protein BCR44DRAFT_1103359 [Catenaria anguillulae PL171]
MLHFLFRRTMARRGAAPLTRPQASTTRNPSIRPSVFLGLSQARVFSKTCHRGPQSRGGSFYLLTAFATVAVISAGGCLAWNGSPFVNCDPGAASHPGEGARSPSSGPSASDIDKESQPSSPALQSRRLLSACTGPTRRGFAGFAARFLGPDTGSALECQAHHHHQPVHSPNLRCAVL